MSNAQKNLETGNGLEAENPTAYDLAKLTLKFLLATKYSFLILHAFLLILFALWIYSDLIFGEISPDSFIILITLYFFIGVWSVAVYAVHINLRLNVDDRSTPIPKSHWKKILKPTIPHNKFIFFWCLLFFGTSYLRNIGRHPEAFDVSTIVSGIAHIAYWIVWIASFRVYLILPAAALGEPIKGAWHLGAERMGKMWLATSLTCLLFFLFSITLVMFLIVPTLASGSEEPEYIWLAVAQMVILSFQIASIVTYSVMYHQFKKEGILEPDRSSDWHKEEKGRHYLTGKGRRD